MRRFFLISDFGFQIFFILLIVALPIGCRKAGRGENVPHPRIISHSPSITRIIFDLGLGDNLVGVTNWCSLPAEGKYAKIPRIADVDGIRTERAIVARPDLIFTQCDPARGLFRNVQQRLQAVKVVQVEIESLDDIFSAVEKIARATNRQVRAGEVIAGMRKKLSVLDYRGELPPPVAKLRVLFCSDYSKPMVAAEGTYIGDMIRRAGAINAGDDIPGKQLWRKAKVESIIAARPDVLIIKVSPGQEDAAEKFWLSRKGVPAACCGGIHAVTDNRWLRPGPAVCDLAVELRRMIPVPK